MKTTVTIGICGGGTMGAGIAYTCLLAGHTVIVFDSFEPMQERCGAFLQQQFEKAVTRGIATQSSADAAFKRYSFVSELGELRSCAIVIEAIVEDKTAKHQLFQALESILSETAIIASNTSSISVTALGAILQRPERFVGMHFFNPAHAMKLVEVIRGVKTSPDVLDSTIALATQLGKTPVLAKDVPGFIVNRVARSFYLESMRLVEEGAAEIEQVDAIMRSAGFKMGPFELVDVIGVDVNYAVTLSVWEQYFYEPRFTPVLLQKQYVDAGLHGRKTGEGFYEYDLPTLPT
jgi:3-hydroxybutyryl-CoA dehydrogenase